MKNIAVALAIVLTLTIVATEFSDLNWETYKKQFGKRYLDPSQDSIRESIFMKNKQAVERHNSDFGSKVGYLRGINRFSDWTATELANLGAGPKLSAEKHHEITRKRLNESGVMDKLGLSISQPVPDELDWRAVAGVVTDVQDQGKGCRADWAFATVGLIEGQLLKLNYSQLSPLSAQNLIDCANRGESCESGGLVSDALLDVYERLGINKQSDYPYDGKKLRCRYHMSLAIGSRISGYRSIEPDESAIKQVVAQFGPVAVALDPTGLADYKSGIITENSHCKQDANSASKAALIVGYGTDKSYGDYWIVKNSWGQRWGEDGYFRIARNKNLCGIAQLAIIPDFY